MHVLSFKYFKVLDNVVSLACLDHNYHEENWTFHYKKMVVVPSPGPTERQHLSSRHGDP